MIRALDLADDYLKDPNAHEVTKRELLAWVIDDVMNKTIDHCVIIALGIEKQYENEAKKAAADIIDAILAMKSHYEIDEEDEQTTD